MKLWQGWYWAKNLQPKFFQVWANTRKEAIKKIEKYEDFYELDFIKSR